MMKAYQQSRPAKGKNHDNHIIRIVSEDIAFSIVADGRGDRNGKRASSVVCSTFGNDLETRLIEEGTANLDAFMLDRLTEVNNEILIKKGCGTTAVIAIVDKANGIIDSYHIGDSSQFIVYDNGDIEYVTPIPPKVPIPTSPPDSSLGMFEFSENEGGKHEISRYLTHKRIDLLELSKKPVYVTVVADEMNETLNHNSVPNIVKAQNTEKEPDNYEVVCIPPPIEEPVRVLAPPRKPMYLVNATDGLTNALSHDEILRIVKNHRVGKESPQNLLDALVEAARVPYDHIVGRARGNEIRKEKWGQLAEEFKDEFSRYNIDESRYAGHDQMRTLFLELAEASLDKQHIYYDIGIKLRRRLSEIEHFIDDTTLTLIDIYDPHTAYYLELEKSQASITAKKVEETDQADGSSSNTVVLASLLKQMVDEVKTRDEYIRTMTAEISNLITAAGLPKESDIEELISKIVADRIRLAELEAKYKAEETFISQPDVQSLDLADTKKREIEPLTAEHGETSKDGVWISNENYMKLIKITERGENLVKIWEERAEIKAREIPKQLQPAEKDAAAETLESFMKGDIDPARIGAFVSYPTLFGGQDVLISHTYFSIYEGKDPTTLPKEQLPQINIINIETRDGNPVPVIEIAYPLYRYNKKDGKAVGKPLIARMYILMK